MKKKRMLLSILIALSIIVTFVLTLPFLVRLLMLGSGVEYGIESYSPADSSVGICDYLTVRAGSKEPSSFINKYAWKDAYYRYEYNYTYTAQKETVLLAFSYSDNLYSVAVDDINSQDGFSKEICFDYYDFSFYLNNTESQLTNKSGGNQQTDYILTGDAPYIKWINLVAFSKNKNIILFLGFYYTEFNDFFGRETGHYEFNDWDSFLDENFSFYTELKNN